MKKKIEFTVKIEAEIEENFELNEKVFLDIPFFSIKLCHTKNDGKTWQIGPVNFLSCKTTKTKVIDLKL